MFTKCDKPLAKKLEFTEEVIMKITRGKKKNSHTQNPFRVIINRNLVSKTTVQSKHYRKKNERYDILTRKFFCFWE